MVPVPGPQSSQSEAQDIPISNAEPAHELGKAGGLTHEHSEDVIPSDHDANPDHGPSSQLLQEQAGADSIVTAGEGSDLSTSSGEEMDQDESDSSEESSEDYEPPEAGPAEASTGLLDGESLSHIDTTVEMTTATRERNAQESVSQLPDAQQDISGAKGPSPDSGREVLACSLRSPGRQLIRKPGNPRRRIASGGCLALGLRALRDPSPILSCLPISSPVQSNSRWGTPVPDVQ